MSAQTDVARAARADRAVDAPARQRVAAADRPAPRGHVRELEAELLPRAARGVLGPADPQAVVQGVGCAVVEEAVDQVIGQVRGGEGRRPGHGGADGRGRLLALGREVPALPAAADQHPAAAVRGHVAVELLRSLEGGRVQPVQAVGSRWVDLLGLPAGGDGARLERPVSWGVCGGGRGRRQERRHEGGGGDDGRAHEGGEGRAEAESAHEQTLGRAPCSMRRVPPRTRPLGRTLRVGRPDKAGRTVIRDHGASSPGLGRAVSGP